MNSSSIKLRVDVEPHLADIDKQIDKYEKNLSELQKQADSMGFGDNIKKEIEDAMKKLKELRDDYASEVRKLANEKLDTNSFDDFSKDIEIKMEQVSQDILNAEEKIQNLQKTVDTLDLDKISDEVNNMSSAFRKFKDDTKLAMRMLKKFSSMTEQQTQAQKSLKGVAKQLNEINKIELFDTTGIDKKKIKNVDELNQELAETYKNYVRLRKIVTDKSGKFDSSQIADAEKQLVSLMPTLSEYIKKVAVANGYDLSENTGFKFADSKGTLFNLDKIIQLVDKDLPVVKKRLKDKAEKLNETINDTLFTNVNTFTFKDGGVKIPVFLDEKMMDKIDAQLTEFINTLSAQSEEHPVDVTLRLFPLKTNKEEAKAVNQHIKDIRAQIPKFEDKDLADSVEKLMNDFEKEYQRALMLKIKVELTDDAEGVAHKVEQIKEAVRKADISVSPRIEVSEKEAKEFSDKLDKVKGDFTVDFTQRMQNMADSLNRLLSEGKVKNWSKAFKDGLEAISIKLQNMKDLLLPLSELYSTMSAKKQGRGRPSNEFLAAKGSIDKFSETMDALNKSLLDRENAPSLNPAKFTQQIQEAIDEAGIPVQVPVEPNTEGFAQALEEELGVVPINIRINGITGTGNGNGSGNITVSADGNTVEKSDSDSTVTNKEKSKSKKVDKQELLNSYKQKLIDAVGEDYIEKTLSDVFFGGYKNTPYPKEEKLARDEFKRAYNSYVATKSRLKKNAEVLEDADAEAERIKTNEKDEQHLAYLRNQYPILGKVNKRNGKQYKSLLSKFLKEKGIEETPEDKIPNKEKKAISEFSNIIKGYHSLYGQVENLKNRTPNMGDMKKEDKNYKKEYNKRQKEIDQKLADKNAELQKYIEDNPILEGVNGIISAGEKDRLRRKYLQGKGIDYSGKISEDVFFGRLSDEVVAKGDFPLTASEKNGIDSATAKQNKADMEDILNRFIAYKAKGGGKSIDDLTENPKVRAKLKKKFREKVGLDEELSDYEDETPIKYVKNKRKSEYNGVSDADLRKRISELTAKKKEIENQTTDDLVSSTMSDITEVGKILNEQRGFYDVKRDFKKAQQLEEQGLIKAPDVSYEPEQLERMGYNYNGKKWVYDEKKASSLKEQGLLLKKPKKYSPEQLEEMGYTLDRYGYINDATEQRKQYNARKEGIKKKYGVDDDFFENLENADATELAKGLLAYKRKNQQTGAIDQEISKITRELNTRERETEEARQAAQETAKKANAKRKQKKSSKPTFQKKIGEKKETEEIEEQNKELEKNKQLKEESKKVEESKDISKTKIETDNIQKQNKEIKNNTKTKQENADAEKGFEKLKTQITSLGDLDQRITGNKKNLELAVSQYQKYLDAGGTRPITDLTDNVKAQSKLKAAYEKTTTAIKEQKVAQKEQGSSTDQLINKHKELKSQMGEIQDRLLKGDQSAISEIESTSKQIMGIRDELQKEGLVWSESDQQFKQIQEEASAREKNAEAAKEEVDAIKKSTEIKTKQANDLYGTILEFWEMLHSESFNRQGGENAISFNSKTGKFNSSIGLDGFTPKPINTSNANYNLHTHPGGVNSFSGTNRRGNGDLQTFSQDLKEGITHQLLLSLNGLLDLDLGKIPPDDLLKIADAYQKFYDEVVDNAQNSLTLKDAYGSKEEYEDNIRRKYDMFFDDQFKEHALGKLGDDVFEALKAQKDEIINSVVESASNRVGDYDSNQEWFIQIDREIDAIFTKIVMDKVQSLKLPNSKTPGLPAVQKDTIFQALDQAFNFQYGFADGDVLDSVYNYKIKNDPEYAKKIHGKINDKLRELIEPYGGTLTEVSPDDAKTYLKDIVSQKATEQIKEEASARQKNAEAAQQEADAVKKSNDKKAKSEQASEVNLTEKQIKALKDEKSAILEKLGAQGLAESSTEELIDSYEKLLAITNKLSSLGVDEFFDNKGLEDLEEYLRMQRMVLKATDGDTNETDWYKLDTNLNERNITSGLYGEEWGRKYIDGVLSTVSESYDAGADIANATAEGAAKASEEQSPSKVADRLGQYWGIGWKEGLEKTKPQIEAAVRDLMDSAKAAAKGVEPLTVQDLQEALLDLKKDPEKWKDYEKIKTPLRNVLGIPKGTRNIEKFFQQQNQADEEESKKSTLTSKDKTQKQETKSTQVQDDKTIKNIRTAKREITKLTNLLNSSDNFSEDRLVSFDERFNKWINKLETLGEDTKKFKETYSSARSKFDSVIEENAGTVINEVEKSVEELQRERADDLEILKQIGREQLGEDTFNIRQQLRRVKNKQGEQTYTAYKITGRNGDVTVNPKNPKRIIGRNLTVADDLTRAKAEEKYSGKANAEIEKQSNKELANALKARSEAFDKVLTKEKELAQAQIKGNNELVDSVEKQLEKAKELLALRTQELASIDANKVAEQEQNSFLEKRKKNLEDIANLRAEASGKQNQAAQKQAQKEAEEAEKEIEKSRQDVQKAEEKRLKEMDKLNADAQKRQDDADQKRRDQLVKEYDEKEKAQKKYTDTASTEIENQGNQELSAALKARSEAYDNVLKRRKELAQAEVSGNDDLIQTSQKQLQDAKEIYALRTKELNAIDANKAAEQEVLSLNERRKKTLEEIDRIRAKASGEQKQAEEKETEQETLKKSKQAYDELAAKVKEYIKLRKDMAKGNVFEGDIENVEKLADEISDLDIQLQNSDLFNADLQAKAMAPLDTIEEEISRIAQTKRTNSFAKLQSQIGKQKIDIDYEIANGKHTEAFNNELKSIQARIDEINAKPLDAITESDVYEAQSLLTEIHKIRKEGGLAANKTANENSIQKGLTQINSILSSNTKRSFKRTDVYRDLVSLQDAFKNFDTSRPQSELAELTTELLKTKAKFEDLDNTVRGKNLFQTFIERLHGTSAQLMAQYLSWMDIIRYTRTMFNTIRELDTALVDLRKTTSMNVNELNEFYRASTEVGKQLGVTSQQIIQQAADWSRLGYSTKEQATTMAELSSKFASISPGMTTENSTDYLVSTMKAFGIETDKVERQILDNVNRIGNTFATTNSEIGEMLTRSSAAMNAANNSLEETIALEAAAVQVTRNAETTGTAFRTVSMRIRGLDEETEEALENYDELKGKIADLTKTEKTPGGVSLFTDASKTEYKSTYQFLKDISEIWDELTDKEQAGLLETIGGKRGAQSLAPILSNFEEVERAMGEMEGAAGAADAEMDVIRDSIDFKLNELKQTWIGTLQDILQRDDIKELIDMLTSLSEALGGIVSSLGLVKTAIMGFGTIWGSKHLGLFNYDQQSGFSASLSNTFLGGFMNSKQELSGDQTAYAELIHETMKATAGDTDLAVAKVRELNDGMGDLSVETRSWGMEVAKSGKGFESADEACNQLNKSLGQGVSIGGKLQGIFGKLGATLANIGIGFAASMLVNGAIWLVDELIETDKEIEEASEKAKQNVNETTETLKKQKSTVNDVKDRYAELAQNVKNLGTIEQSQGGLSNDEYQEFLDISNQLAELFPTLSAGYDDNGNAILNLSGDVDTIVGSLENLVDVEKEAAAFKVSDQMGDIWKNYAKNVNKSKDQLKSWSKEASTGNGEADNADALESYHQWKNTNGKNMMIDSSTDTGKYFQNFIWDKLNDRRKNAGKEMLEMNDYRKEENGGVFYDFSSLDDETKKEIDGLFSSIINNYKTDVKKAKNVIDAQNKEMGEYVAQISETFTFDRELSDKEQKIMENYIRNFDFSKLLEKNGDDWNKAYDEFYTILNNTFGSLTEADAAMLNKYYNDIFAIDLSEDAYGENVEKVKQFAHSIAEILGEEISDEDILNALGFGNLDDKLDAAKERLQGSKFGKGSQKANQALGEWAGTLSSDELDLLMTIDIDEYSSLEELKKALAEMQKEADAGIDVEIKSSDAVNSMADAKTAITSLNDLYQQTVNKVASDGQATGFADPALMNSVESSFSKFSEALEDAGDEAGAASINAALETFEDTLVRFPNDADKAQEAMDNLITAYIDQTDIIKNLTEENAEWSIEQLKAMGITNAEEVVMTRLNKTVKKTQEAIKRLGKSLTEYNNINGDSAEAEASRVEKLGEMASAVKDAISVYDEEGNLLEGFNNFDVTEGFVKAHLEDIEAMAAGDVEALNRVRLAAAKGAVMEVTTNVPTEVAEQQISGLMDMVAQADAMEIEPGASIDDAAFYTAINAMIKSAGLTAEQVNAAFGSMGYTVEFKTSKYSTQLVKSNNFDKLPASVQEQIKGMSMEFNIPEVEFIAKKANSGAGAKANYGGTGSSGSSGGGDGGGGSDSGNTDKANEDTEETFDWIEVYIQRIEEEIARLDKVIDNVYDNWGDRNDSITKKISKLKDEIVAQQRAYDEYLRNAKELEVNDGKELNWEDYGDDETTAKESKQYQYDQKQLTEAKRAWAEDGYIDKIKNGLIEGEDIQKIENKYLVEIIQKYQEWYNKAIAAKDTIKDLNIQISDSYKQLFENIASEYDDLTGIISKESDIINERISRTQEHGYFVDKSFYEDLLRNEENTQEKLIQERDKLIDQLNKGMDTGYIKPGTEAWYDMYQQIQDVNKAIEESYTEVVKLNNEIRQLEWDRFDWIEERMADVSAEADWLIGLLQGENNYDDKGYYNYRGFAQAGLVGAKYEDDVRRAERYKNEITKINKKIAENGDKVDQNLIARKDELVKAYRDAISAAEEEKKAMQSLVQEGINKHLEALQELIDKYKESMSEAKDLYEYQKNLANQTKNIANLEKQLVAYSGDDSEETRKKRQELQKQLDDAQQQLQETEWDRYISETNQMLDDLKNDYEDYLNDKIESITQVLIDQQKYLNQNGEAINAGIKEIKDEYGITTEYFEDFGLKDGNIFDVLNNGKLPEKLSSIGNILSSWQTSWVEKSDAQLQALRAAVEEKSKDVTYDSKTGKVSIGNTTAVTEENKKIGDNNNKFNETLYAEVQNPGTWKQDSTTGKWWYQHEDGSYTKDEWEKIGDKWYYFDDQGWMASDEYRQGYYLAPDGSWSKEYSGGTWHEDPDYPGWWWYQDGDWYPKNGWYKIDGDWYYFDDHGWMARDVEIGGYTIGSDGKWKGYATGTQNVPKDNLYWTQEKGSEIIYKTSSGAMLTPLNQGDMVFTHEMSQRLWDIASGNIPSGASIIIPDVSSNLQRNVTANNNITIELPNVQNYSDFKRELQNDNDFEKFMQEVTIGQMMGNNKLNKKKY